MKAYQRLTQMFEKKGFGSFATCESIALRMAQTQRITAIREDDKRPSSIKSAFATPKK